MSPSARLHVVGMLRFMSLTFLDINQTELDHFFYSVLVSVSVFIALSTVFHSINSPNNSLLSHSVLLLLFCLVDPFNYVSLYESLPQP